MVRPDVRILLLLLACSRPPTHAPLVLELEVRGPADLYAARVNCAEVVAGELRLDPDAGPCAHTWELLALASAWDMQPPNGPITVTSATVQAPIGRELWFSAEGDYPPRDGGCEARRVVPEGGLATHIAYREVRDGGVLGAASSCEFQYSTPQ